MDLQHKPSSPLSRGKKSSFVVLFLAFFLPFLLLCGIRIIAAKAGGEPGADCYYHAKIAMLGPKVYCAKTFPYLASSIWRRTFADKELFYHVVLQGVTWLKKSIGLGTEPPFNMQAMFFAGLALLGFWTALRAMKISPPVTFLACMLMPFITHGFTFRFLMLRPHVFSIAFMMFLCAMLSTASFRKRLILVSALSFLYAWSYSNPHFILLPVIVYSFFAFKKDSWKILLLPLLTFLGLVLGYVIHPQFPNTFIIWKIQSIDALISPVFSGYGLMPILTPMEMMPGTFVWHRNSILFYLFLYAMLMIFCRLRERQLTTLLSPLEKTLIVLGFLFSAGSFIALRSIEYAVPFSLLAFAALLQHAVNNKVHVPLIPFIGEPKKMYAVLLTFSLIVFIQSGILHSGSNYTTLPAHGPAKWLKEHTAEGSLVVNLDWGDFPAMFFANHRNVLLWGMDPMFSYAENAVTARKLEEYVITSLNTRNVQTLMQRLTGADYAFVLSRRTAFTSYLKKLGWRPVFDSKEGCIFVMK